MNLLNLEMRSYYDLPEEIISQILSRVPAKSVGLCRCVSKPWRTLLSQPNFIKTHLQMSNINSLQSLAIFLKSGYEVEFYSGPLNNAHHLFDEITLSPTKLSFVGYNPQYWHSISGSCDGLLLLVVCFDNMLVINPVTREINIVSRSSVFLYRHQGYHLYGFGYDSVTDDYKIVIISFSGYQEKAQFVTNDSFIDVYSLKTGFSKKLECSPDGYVGSRAYDYYGSRRDHGIFVGDCLHWLPRRTTDNKHAIVAFNLVDEKLREVPRPSFILDDLEGDYKLAVLGGCLCIFCANKHDEVWVMKEYGVLESWTKFTLNNPRGRFECFLSGQEQVVVHQFDPNKRVIWNPKQGTLKEIVLNEFNARSDIHGVAASFVESLVSPHGSNDKERES